MFNFDKVISRVNTNSRKWEEDSQKNIIPMWIADMDFQSPPAVIEALKRRAEHGIFGYASIPDSYYDATIDWFERRHQVSIDKQWILPTTGVVPALSAIIKALTEKDDQVIVQTPAYNCFFSSIKNNGCKIIENPLMYQSTKYEINFEHLKHLVKDPRTKLLIFCNPHNPTGRVWREDELRRIAEVCFEYDITVISDEIHCDLSYSPNKYIPFASLGSDFEQRSITCNSPSKSFNLAGLQVANIYTANLIFREKINRALNDNEVCEINPFAIDGLIAAYQYSEDWLDALKHYLFKNYITLKHCFEINFPEYPIVPLEATYLPWIDISQSGTTSNAICDILLNHGKVHLNSGTLYGKDGEGFVRMNIACPRTTLIQAIHQMKNALNNSSRKH